MKTYEDELNFYYSLIQKYRSPLASRREKEYASYLETWFSETPSDGAPFNLKRLWKVLPMSLTNICSDERGYI